jgi:hypothetical protein
MFKTWRYGRQGAASHACLLSMASLSVTPFGAVAVAAE